MLQTSTRSTTALGGAVGGLFGVGASMLLAAVPGGTSSASAPGDRVVLLTRGWPKDLAVEERAHRAAHDPRQGQPG